MCRECSNQDSENAKTSLLSCLHKNPHSYEWGFLLLTSSLLPQNWVRRGFAADCKRRVTPCSFCITAIKHLLSGALSLDAEFMRGFKFARKCGKIFLVFDFHLKSLTSSLTELFVRLFYLIFRGRAEGTERFAAGILRISF